MGNTSSILDIIIAADLRFPGGTSSAIAEEIKANARAGFSTGIIQLKAPTLVYPHPINPKIRALIEDGLAQLLDPEQLAHARLLCAHHPLVFEKRSLVSLPIECERRILILHHPPFDGLGQPFYNIEDILANAEPVLGGPVELAPVGPLVRQQLEDVASPPPILGFDWHNLIDVDAWRGVRTSSRRNGLSIGRHSRADPLKWPDTRAEILAAYPDDPEIAVHILGAGPFLKKRMGSYPPNWTVHAFDAMPAGAFLRGLDFFVYYHSRRWVEAFGISILEAIASGIVPILPASFEPLFGDAAHYCEIDDVQDSVRVLHDETPRRQEIIDAGQQCIGEKFSHSSHEKRLKEIIGNPRRHGSRVSVARGTRRVMFITSNGIGMGHLTRVMAIARRCSPSMEPIIVTMSQAFSTARKLGFLVEYIPHHSNLSMAHNKWNKFLKVELMEKIAFYDARVIVFDGNVPFGGLVEMASARPQLFFIWSRRSLWRPGETADYIERERSFYAVIEPRDIASIYDRGTTRDHTSRTRVVDPIRLFDESGTLSREESREYLGLNATGTVVLVQLGSGNNYDYAAMRNAVLDKLLTQGDVQIVELVSPIANASPSSTEGVEQRTLYPISPYIRAFDFAVSACGYNSFHELVLGGVPTIFVPNENPIMDDQLARAAFADSHELSLCVRVMDVYRVRDCIDRLLNPQFRRSITANCNKLTYGDGAAEAAGLIEELAYTVRTDCDGR